MNKKIQFATGARDSTAPAEQGRFMLTGYLFFLVRLIIFTTLFFFPVYLKDMGFSGWQIGLLMGIDSLMTLLTTLPMGISNDMFPSRMLVASSFGALGVTYFALSFSTSFAMLLLLIMCYGTWYNLGQISIRSLFFKTAHSQGKGRRFSSIAFAEHMGIAAGALLGGLLLGWLSFPAVLRICGVLFFLIVPLGLLLPGTLAQIFEPAVYKKEIFRRDVVMFALVTFLYTYHWGAEKTVYVLFLKESLGFSQAGIGVFIGLTVIALALACLVYGRLLDRGVASLRRLIIAGLGLSAGGHILLAFSQTQAQAWIFRTIHELGDASFMVFSYVMTSNLFSKARVGGGSGFIAQVAVLGTFAGALASGAIMQELGPRMAMIVAGALSLADLFLVNRLDFAPGRVPPDDGPAAEAGRRA
ncbi:MAG: MFS transporter [Proteobacteria bacterium]|nr:MFS transporter [Pseudomonadota bacterium]